ncbi:restriction endonuclease subunit S [Aliivibrio fischeri]|uniref:restriction endonuclease subunit S n=1 Tax=Aliivibrio fischeri TaxID=668 RepID=UPI0007C5CCF1|nr:restriction endonuclease subunit S [Aliivibrio fischeri]
MSVERLITDHIDVWTSTVKTKSASGRGSSKKIELYGIKKLRELILELAVRGKLIPQDPTDEPASVLLERIAEEKSQLMKEKKIKKSKQLPEISDDEMSFFLPTGWEWAYLQDLTTYIQRGKGPTYAESGFVQVVSQKCVQNSGFDLTAARYVTDDSLGKYQEERYLQDNDILWNSTGTGTVGRANVITNIPEKRIVADSHVTVIRPTNIYSRFLWCFIMAPGIQSRIQPDHENALVSGSTKQVELNTSSVISVIVPVAPRQEQHRIVAKVDELMSLCDQLEQQTETSIEVHQTLVEVLLNTLTLSANAEELMQNWQRISEHFDALFITEKSIDSLKQTILQLAVMGKLVPQDPNDEPAAKLLERIAEEKAQLIKDKKIKKQKALPEITEDEKPFDLPSGWEVCRLAGLIPQFQNGASSRGDKDGREVVVLRLADIRDWQVSLNDTRSILIENKSIERYSLEQGDVLIIRVNGSADIVGRFITCNEDYDAIYCDHFIRMRFPIECYVSSFLSILGSSKLVRDKISDLFISTAGQKTVNQTHIGSLITMLPPIAEQHRIVAKVKELMAICEQFKQRLKESQTTQLHLTDAIVEQAV